MEEIKNVRSRPAVPVNWVRTDWPVPNATERSAPEVLKMGLLNATLAVPVVETCQFKTTAYVPVSGNAGT
jgi:hypothetical protein